MFTNNQLTIYHQLIGQPCKMLNRTGVIVGITELNGIYYGYINDKFEPAKPSPFHNHKFVYRLMVEIDLIKLIN